MFLKVTTNVKVLSVFHPLPIGNKNKQDITVADSTGIATVTLWEKDVGSLQQTLSYCLKNFVVKEYRSIKYLSMARNGSDIEDIGHVSAEVVNLEETHKHIKFCNAQVVAVMQLDKYITCLKCKARVEPATPPFGRCSKLECT